MKRWVLCLGINGRSTVIRIDDTVFANVLSELRRVAQDLGLEQVGAMKYVGEGVVLTVETGVPLT